MEHIILRGTSLTHMRHWRTFVACEREDLSAEHRKALRKIIETWKRHYEQVF